MRNIRKPGSGRMAVAALTGAATVAAVGVGIGHAAPPPSDATATPIKHLVVIYQENVSFDHYFATYPQAANPAGSSGSGSLTGQALSSPYRVSISAQSWLVTCGARSQSMCRVLSVQRTASCL